MEYVRDRKCDECEKSRKELLYCSNCIEILCAECDIRIHNKGTRVSHGRIPFSNEFYSAKGSSQFVVTYLATTCGSLEGRGSNDLLRLQVVALLGENAAQGILQVELDRVVAHLASKAKMSRSAAEGWLEAERGNGLFLLHERSFDSKKTATFVSLHLKSISVEALGWVLLSLRNDRMQPVETLFHSRFKECFQMKVSMKDWKIFVEEMTSVPGNIQALNRYKELTQAIEITTDAEDVKVFGLVSEKWVYEDLLEIREDCADYQELVRFLNEYFREPPDSEDSAFQVSQAKSLSSGGSFYSEIPKGKGRVLKRAIPGGKYGCALLVKHCSTPALQALSLGKISSLIRLALQNQVISHFKTLIIQNEKGPESQSAEKDRMIAELQEKVLTILKENAEKGVTLAQLPFLLSHKTGHFQNFQDLGFPKLKNFLATMNSQIVLEKSHNNHIKIYLLSAKPAEPGRTFIDPRDFSSEQSSSMQTRADLSRTRDLRGGSSTLKPNAFDVKCKQLNSIDPVNHAKSYSTVQQYFETIRFQLINILNEHRYGIEIGQLETLLNRYTDHHFDWRRNKESFQDFLINNFDDYVSISVSLDKLRRKRITTVCAKSWSIAPTYHRPRTMHNEYGFGVNNSKQVTADLSDNSFGFKSKRNEDSFNNFFEFQVISPIPSLTTSKMGATVDDQESDESDLVDDGNNPDDNSLALVNKLLEENEKF